MTTRIAGGLLLGYNPLMPASASRRWPSLRSGPLPLTRGEPVKPACPSPGLKRVLVLLHAQLVQRDVAGFLLPDAFRDRGPVQTHGRDAVALRPELPVAEPVLEVGVPVEDHQRALPLQVAHHARDEHLRWDRHQHVHVVRHEVPLYDLDPLVLAQPLQDLAYVGPDLIVYDFAPILRRKHNVVLARPLRVRKAIGFLRHSRPPPFLLEFLTA